MGKRGVLVLVLSIFLILSFGFVIADHEKDQIGDGVDGGGFPPECATVDCLQGYHCVVGGSCVLDSEGDFDDDLFEDLEEEYGDAVITDPGITPDSFFYFIDEFFDRFGSDLENREEKIAEIKAMIEEGNFEAAREALESYRRHAESWEEDADPNERDEARRSAAAIHRALREFEDDIPDEFHKEFFDDVLEREGRLITAVEISSKIKELCEALSELDPSEYSRVCRTDDSDANWHRALDRDLTEAQIKEAEEFGEIMSECFATSGGTCRCEEISFTAFAEQCTIIAPLAYACDVLDDEVSCDKMDEIEEGNDPFDLLPDYLREVLDRIERQYDDDQYDHHIPRACLDAGITGEERGDRDRCFRIMVEREAPRPCIEAVQDGRIKIDNERAFREACERIMFDEEAPFECIEAGIDNFRDCGVLMFQLNAPQECIDSGLTGENRGDERACREIVGDGGVGDRRGPGPGFECGGIEGPGERLACYDAAAQGTHDRFEERDEFYDDYEETRDLEKQCAETCSAEGGAWSFNNGVCDCRFRDEEPLEETPPPTDEPEFCIDVFDPVCGVNGKTYSNSCFAGLEDVEVSCGGECPCVTEPPTEEPPPEPVPEPTVNETGTG